MQSTYTPGNLTTMIPGAGGMVPAGGDGFMDMARLLFRRRMMAEDKAKRTGRPSMVAEASKAPLNVTTPTLGGGGYDPVRQMQQQMMVLDLQKAREASRPLPTKNVFTLNANSTPGGAGVPDWSRVSLANLPANGGIQGSPELSRGQAQGLQANMKAGLDASTAAGEAATSGGMSPDDAAFEQQLRRLLAARGR